MVVIPRSLARQYRAVLRRCGTRQDFQRDPIVLARAGREGLALECVLNSTALRVCHPGKREEDSIAFPASTLAQIEGRGDDPVTLEEVSTEQGRAVWAESGSTMIKGFRVAPPERHPDLPRLPSSMIKVGSDTLRALCDAAQTAATQETARSLNRVLLSGSGGRMIATDGRQLLIQDGFTFPFQEEILVPSLSIWGSKELPREEEVLIGLGKEYLTVCLGPWSVAMRSEPRGRFPPAESIVPSARGVKTRLRLGPEDVALLCKELPRLPAGDECDPAVEMDIGHDVVIRPRDGSRDSSGGLRLSGAEFRGSPVRVAMNPRHLLRALGLGFREVEIVRPDVPLCCRSPHRVYVWMPLTNNTPATSVPVNQSSEESSAMPDDNGKHSTNGGPTSAAVFDPLAEAEEIRGLLHEAQSRLTRLTNALRQFRRQSRALRSAVASLREMPPLVP